MVLAPGVVQLEQHLEQEVDGEEGLEVLETTPIVEVGAQADRQTVHGDHEAGDAVQDDERDWRLLDVLGVRDLQVGVVRHEDIGTVLDERVPDPRCCAVQVVGQLAVQAVPNNEHGERREVHALLQRNIKIVGGVGEGTNSGQAAKAPRVRYVLESGDRLEDLLVEDGLLHLQIGQHGQNPVQHARGDGARGPVHAPVDLLQVALAQHAGPALVDSFEPHVELEDSLHQRVRKISGV
mmetsp:Transcript_1906/g.5513  ORF Transcript_1906/g.5513 Transcript_1906/m.5513 type:complete len:237 (-) Transcript_1906:297-1007(-)